MPASYGRREALNRRCLSGDAWAQPGYLRRHVAAGLVL
jgi:hypothetical protein